MKHFFIRFQLILTSIVLLITFGLMLRVVTRYSVRWDLTEKKVHSLSAATVQLLGEMKTSKTQVLAFYPADDTARTSLEILLKECRSRNPNLEYSFYDADRVPSLASQYDVQKQYTVIIKYAGKIQKVVAPSEEKFATALFNLIHPEMISVCFLTGHGEFHLTESNRNGLSKFGQLLEDHNYSPEEVLFARDHAPEKCQVLAVPGPHFNFEESDWKLFQKMYDSGKGILFLIDPMDASAGAKFQNYFSEKFGLLLGADVIVDKMSRAVGGDFLVPMVDQFTDHPAVSGMSDPVFFPVSRSIQMAPNQIPDLEVIPLFASGSGSWAETNLAALETGNAAFEPAEDLAGPIVIAAAVEPKDKQKQGRLIVVGDSDFASNAYLHLSGNETLLLKMIKWLARDNRFVNLPDRVPDFKPLFMKPDQHFIFLSVSLVLVPLFFLITGASYLILRKRKG